MFMGAANKKDLHRHIMINQNIKLWLLQKGLSVMLYQFTTIYTKHLNI